MEKTQREITSRVLNALIFMMAFVIVGWGVPTIIERVIPTSYYYTVQNPALTTKESYQPGEEVRVILTRNSRIFTGGIEIIELTLVETDGQAVIQTIQRPLNIEKGAQTIKMSLLIPENSPPGEYFIQATIIFETRDVRRFVPFYTEHFYIEPVAEIQ